MQQPPQLTKIKPARNPWLFFLWGFLAGLLTAALCAVIILAIRVPLRSLMAEPTAYPVLDAQVKLTVAADSCGVERGEVSGSSAVTNLTWVVVDDEGYSVLERSAEGEYQYRYFQGGHYTVHVNAWYAGQYHSISNEVSIDC